MSRRKQTKAERISEDRLNLLADFLPAQRACIHAGINISPECIADKSRWRVVIQFVDSNGNIKERIASDRFKKPEDLHKNRIYSSVNEVNLKTMELYIFYAKHLGS